MTDEHGNEIKKLRTIRRHERLEKARKAREDNPYMAGALVFYLGYRRSGHFRPKFVTDKYGNRVRTVVINSE